MEEEIKQKRIAIRQEKSFVGYKQSKFFGCLLYLERELSLWRKIILC